LAWQLLLHYCIKAADHRTQTAAEASILVYDRRRISVTAVDHLPEATYFKVAHFATYAPLRINS
jgi:hypothetical protein